MKHRAGGPTTTSQPPLPGHAREMPTPAELSSRVHGEASSSAPDPGWYPFVGLRSRQPPRRDRGRRAGGMEHLVLGTQHGGRAETVAAEQCREVIGMCRRLDDMGMSAAVLQVAG